MRLNKIIFFILLILIAESLSAQQSEPHGLLIPPRSTSIEIPDPEQRLQNVIIPYEQITGSQFWKDSIQYARLYGSAGSFGVYPVRINFATNEIYFTKGREELVLTDKLVTKIVVKLALDSAVFIGQVPNLLLKNKRIDAFVQVLTSGKYQLLKYVKRVVVSVETPSRTAKTYHFADEKFYFIKSQDKVEYIRKLNKENIFLFLPTSSNFQTWIKENDINLKKEADIIRFLNYYNKSI
jgi:hypothetical protein